MKMIFKLGSGALIAAMGISAAGCSNSDSNATLAKTSAATTPPATAAAPIPSPNQHQSPEDKVPRVTVEETKKLAADAKIVIIDVRGTDAYKISHIKGALDITVNKLESGEFKDLPKDKRIITYCA